MILYKSLKKIISKQEWYIENKAYRPQLVTYTFSKFVYEVKKIKYNIDYKHIWDEQAISSEMEEELAKIAKLSFDNMYGDREISNISSYCKTKPCWERLQSTPYELSTRIKKDLISDDDRTIDMTRAKKEQRNDNYVNFSIEIFKKGEAYWQDLVNRATEQRALNYHDLELLEVAKKSCVTGRIVSNKQADTIKKIIDSLKEVGIE